MSYAELLVYLAIFYLIIFLIIGVSTISYLLMNKSLKAQSIRSMFHIGRPVVQFLIIFMIISVIVMTSKYFKVRTFSQVVACEKTGSVYSMNVKIGRNEAVTVRDKESIHQILTALEETTFLPSLKESSVLTKNTVGGREISLEFLGMEEIDKVTVSSRGYLYNHRDGQAYEITDEELFYLLETVLGFDESL